MLVITSLSISLRRGSDIGGQSIGRETKPDSRGLGVGTDPLDSE